MGITRCTDYRSNFVAMIEITYTKSLTFFSKTKNIYHQKTTRIDKKQLAMTIDGPEHIVQTDKVPHSALTKTLVKLCCNLTDVSSHVLAL